MKIESLLRITGGVLLNTPSVNTISDIKISPAKILSKDLFIDINNSEDEISEAIKNGAYCIVTASIPNITDEEIAWICVESLHMALIKLSRFFATDKNFNFVLLSSLQYQLSKYLHLETKVQTLSQTPSDALLQIINAPSETIFFVIDNAFITKIDPTLTPSKNSLEPDSIFEKSIFYSSFIFSQKFFTEIRLPSIFIPHLCSLLHYLDTSEIEYTLENFNNFEHFYPQFIDNSLHAKDFGTTRKALIFESDCELFQEEINFLERKIDFNDLIVFIPTDKVDSFTCKAQKIVYKHALEIDKLKNRGFRYALIYGKISDFQESMKEKCSQQMTLF
jgi:ferrochelatase